MENIIITFENGIKKEYKKGIKLKEIIEDIKKDYPFYKLYLRRLRCLPAWEIDLIAVKQ